MSISTIRGVGRYLSHNSNFSGHTINSVIIALGFHPLHGTHDEFRELSRLLKECAENEKAEGFLRFFNYNKKFPIFRDHRKDIVSHMEQTAEDCGIDVISMVQNFGIYCNSSKPTISQIGKALWDSGNYQSEFENLYNVFARYTLEELAQTWYRYLEENNAIKTEKAA
jgi:hypothetical protein